MNAETREAAAQQKDANRSYLRWAAVFLIAAVVMAFFFGLLPIVPLAVATGSMEPDISIGDAVLVSRGETDSLEVGDVIAYSLNGQIVVHRITERRDTDAGVVYQTQGDSNNAPDPRLVSTQQIYGKVLATIPYAGVPSLWIRSLISKTDTDIANPCQPAGICYIC